MDIVQKYSAGIRIFILLTIITAIWGYFAHRSRSAYNIIDKVWSIFIGEKGFNNGIINRFHKERHDIDKFNSIYNLDAINTLQIEKFTKWIERHNVDIRKVSGLKNWFKIDKLEPKKPGVFVTIFEGTIITLTFLLASTLNYVGSAPYVFVKVNPNEPWVMVNHYNASPVFSNSTITPQKCTKPSFNKQEYSRKTNLSTSSIDSICRSFTNEEDARKIDENIRSQKQFLFMGIYFLIVFIVSLRYFKRRIRAHRFYDFYEKNIKPNC